MAAAATRDLRYNRRSTNGSLARSLEWELRERELEDAGKVRERKKTREQTIEKPRSRVRAREADHVSLSSVATMVLVLGLSVLMLYGYIQLTMISGATVSLKNDLENLKAENVLLTAKYEQMFDLTAVKAAAEAAGMSKPGSSQVSYVDLSEGDAAVIYRKSGPTLLTGLKERLKDGAETVVEYLN